MKALRAISFDLDDTLWAIWPVIDRAETALHDYICKTFPRIGETHGAGDLRLQRNEIYEQRPDLAHDLTELRRVSFELLLERHGYDPEASHDLIARFLDLRHDVTLFPDVVPALARLSERFPLIALSNGRIFPGWASPNFFRGRSAPGQRESKNRIPRFLRWPAISFPPSLPKCCMWGIILWRMLSAPSRQD